MVALFSTNASRKGARVSSDANYALNLKERFFFSAKFSWWPSRGKKSRQLKHWHSVSFCQWDPPTLTFLHCKQVSSWLTWQLLVVTIWCLHEAWNTILQHWEIDLNWTVFLSAFCLAKKFWLCLNKFAVVQWKLTNQSSREKPSLFFFFSICRPGAWVTATDLPDILPNLTFNLTRNTRGRCRYSPQAVALTWGRDLERDFPHHSYRYDYVLAADVVYHHGCLEELLETMRHFCRPGSRATLLWANKVRFQADLSFSERFQSCFSATLLLELPQQGVRIYKATAREWHSVRRRPQNKRGMWRSEKTCSWRRRDGAPDSQYLLMSYFISIFFISYISQFSLHIFAFFL